MSIRGRIRGKTVDIFWAEMGYDGYDMRIKTYDKYHKNGGMNIQKSQLFWV